MNDTAAVVDQFYGALLMRRSGAERLRMGSDMFDAARALVRAGLGDASGADNSPAMKVRLFVRIYGDDFDVATQARIIARLAEGRRPVE